VLQSIAASYYDFLTFNTPEKVLYLTSGTASKAAPVTLNQHIQLLGYRRLLRVRGRSFQLPDIAGWSAKEQFDRGLLSSDSVAGARFPLKDTEKGGRHGVRPLPALDEVYSDRGQGCQQETGRR
jgi:hypothetical protein